jgi:UrcA family protein
MKPQAMIPALVATLTLVSAGTASAEPTHRLAYGDLDLSRPADARVLDQRIIRIARVLCNDRSSLDQFRCERGVRDEALGQLPDPARADYAAARPQRYNARVPTSGG